MADRYWVGGTGNWDAATTTNWSSSSGGAGGASVPTSSDNVIFDTLSNANAYTCTITATANCADITIANPASGALTLAGSSALNVFGSFTISSNITRTYTGTITFSATSTGKTITFNGETMASTTTFNGVGGGWTLQDAWNNGSSTINLNNGTLDTNGQTITTTGNFFNNAGTATLTLGASTLNVGVFQSVGTLTVNPGTSVINMTSGGNTFAGNGKTYYTLNLTGAGTMSVSGVNTFTNLSRVPTTPSKTDILNLASNQTVTGTFTVSNGATVTNRVLIQSSVVGTTRTITAAAVSISNADFMDITGAGAASWDLSAISGGSGDCGGNSGITFTAPATQTATGTASFTWSTHGWTTRVPLPQDDVVVNNAFIAGRTVTIDMPRMGKSVDFSGSTGTPDLNFTVGSGNGANLFGSLNVTGTTINAGSFAFTFAGRGGAYTLTTGGVNMRGFTVAVVSGSVTLQDHVTGTTGTITITNGTFDANNKNVTASVISSNNSNTRVITMGSGTWEVAGTGTVWSFATVTNLTLNQDTSTIKITNTSATTRTFAGGGKTYNNFWSSAGASTASLVITGANTFADFKDDGTGAHTITFPNSTTTVSSWNVNGTLGNLITLQRTGASGNWTISDSSGTNSSSYVSISNSIATGGATWNANDGTSTDGGGNTGWNFVAGTTTGNMLLVF